MWGLPGFGGCERDMRYMTPKGPETKVETTLLWSVIFVTFHFLLSDCVRCGGTYSVPQSTLYRNPDLKFTNFPRLDTVPYAVDEETLPPFTPVRDFKVGSRNSDQ